MRSDLIITRIPPHTEDWFKYRESGIGGSEMACVLGLDPYNTIVRLFHEKIGSVPHRTFDNSKMFMGRYLEDKIADLWTFWDGTEENWIENFKNNKVVRQCRRVNGFVVNPSYPWMFGSFDRVQNISGGINLITGEPLKTEAVLEVKTISYWAAQKWADAMPLSFLIQVHVYMIILETDYAEIAILQDGNMFRVEKIPRDNELCDRIINISKMFWENRILPAKEAFAKRQQAEINMNMTELEKYDALIQKYEPEPDKSEAYKEFMEERFLREREVVEGTVEQYNLCKKDTLLRRLGSRLDEERTGIKNLLLKAIGISGAEVIDFGTLGSVNWSERKGAKNRTFTIRIKEVPTEDQVEKEFKKINLEAY
jgi:putative phage-type endonuclease